MRYESLKQRIMHVAAVTKNAPYIDSFFSLQIGSLTIGQLKPILKRKGLKVGGKKAELCHRIVSFFSEC